MKKLKIRAILDAEEDVFRDVLITADSKLMDLHLAFKLAFDFESDELASFYFTDDEWMQGEEIPMEDMFDEGTPTMSDITIEKALKMGNGKLIYVYDFLNLWTFFVELVEEIESENQESETIFIYGIMPKEAPQKNMIVDESIDDQFNLDLDIDFEQLEL